MKRHHLNRIAASVALCALPGLAQACNSDPYIGTVCVFAMDCCPQGYFPADGRSLSTREYTAQFGLIGFSDGGDGKNYFQIPDLRGRVPVGTGTGPGLVPVAIPQTLGQQSVVLTATQTPVAAHVHPATFAPTTGAATIAIPATPGTWT